MLNSKDEVCMQQVQKDRNQQIIMVIRQDHKDTGGPNTNRQTARNCSKDVRQTAAYNPETQMQGTWDSLDNF